MIPMIRDTYRCFRVFWKLPWCLANPTSYFTPGKSRTYERITIEDANSERVFLFESQGVRGKQTPLGIAHQTLVRLYRTAHIAR